MGFELNKFMVPTLYGRALHRLNLDMITRVLNYAAEKRVHMSPDFVDRVKTDLDKLRVKIIEFVGLYLRFLFVMSALSFSLADVALKCKQTKNEWRECRRKKASTR